MGLWMHCLVTRQLMSPLLFSQLPKFHLPDQLCRVFISERPDWGSQSWTELFTSSLTVVSSSLPRRCTSQANMLHLVLQPVFRESLTGLRSSFVSLCGVSHGFQYLIWVNKVIPLSSSAFSHHEQPFQPISVIIYTT